MTARDIAAPKIGTPLARDLLGLGETPGADFFVMARQQHIGHGAAAPALRPGVMGIFQQALFEAFLDQGLSIAEHAGQQAHAGIHQHDLLATEDSGNTETFL